MRHYSRYTRSSANELEKLSSRELDARFLFVLKAFGEITHDIAADITHFPMEVAVRDKQSMFEELLEITGIFRDTWSEDR